MAKGHENVRPFGDGSRTEDEERAMRVKGGQKSGETRRKKRDAKEAINLLLSLAATGNLDQNLEKLGVPVDERTNMLAMQARMFTSAIGGDINAYRALMEYGGFSPGQELKDEEAKARIEAIKEGGRAGAILSGDEDGGSDVMIYLPALDDEEEPEQQEGADQDDNKSTTE